MKKIKKYRYVGRNGIITSSILIEGVEHKIDMLCLIAEKGKTLTNGELQLKSVLVYEDEVNDWYEIDTSVGQE